MKNNNIYFNDFDFYGRLDFMYSEELTDGYFGSKEFYKMIDCTNFSDIWRRIHI